MSLPLAQAHYDKYTYLAALTRKLEAAIPDNPSWISVSIFYSILHLMTAHLLMKRNVRFNPGSDRHYDRMQAIRKCPELKYAEHPYRELQDISESVRYDPGFVYTAKHRATVTKHCDTIKSIVEPLWQKHQKHD